MLGPESVEELLGGIATALEGEVLPHVEDPFGRMQLKAAVELLGNLASRTTWDTEQVEAETAELAAPLELLAAAGWPRPPAGEPAADPIARRRAVLGELSSGLRWLAEHAEEPAVQRGWDDVHERISAPVMEEINRLKRGMYR